MCFGNSANSGARWHILILVLMRRAQMASSAIMVPAIATQQAVTSGKGWIVSSQLTTLQR